MSFMAKSGKQELVQAAEQQQKIDESNVGHKLLSKMGWRVNPLPPPMYSYVTCDRSNNTKYWAHTAGRRRSWRQRFWHLGASKCAGCISQDESGLGREGQQRPLHSCRRL